MTPETHYVLLIHGTWTNSPGWHSSNASSENFCSALKEELALYGLADAVWRTGNGGSVEFNWNGSNKHEDRLEAGDFLARRLVATLGWLMIRPVTILWERVWTRRLMQLLSASAYGVQLHELDGALIVASNHLEEPRFFTENIWDVTKLLISSGGVRDEVELRHARYSFLWENSDFQERRNLSWIWRSIEPHRKEIEKHYSRFPQNKPIGSEDQLTRACIMLEERFSEAIGAVGLMHTAYHSNRVVVAAVARFISSGVAPVDEQE